MKSTSFSLVEIALTVSAVISPILRFKFIYPEKDWILFSIICAISALVGILVVREISASTKKRWLIFLLGIILIVIMFFLLAFIISLVFALTRWKIDMISILFFYIFDYFSAWLILTTLVIPLEN